MTQMVEGGRPLARVRIFGFPVTLDISFVIVVAILGWYPGVSAQSFVVWLAMVPLAVLVHELGHAFVARSTGAQPAITLAGLGGLTTYVPPRPLSRARSIAISTAGPAVGIVIGVLLLAVDRMVGVQGGLGHTVLNLAVFTTLGWSLLNLLPILPLDGGQTLRELLPGSPAKRAVRAAIVSIVFAAVAAAIAYRAGLLFGALLAAFFIVSNLMTVRNARELDRIDVNQRLLGLLWFDRAEEARALLDDQPSSPSVRPLVRAAVGATAEDAGGPNRGRLAAAAAAGTDLEAPTLLLLVTRVRREWGPARDLVAGPLGGRVDPFGVLTTMVAAQTAGAVREAAEIGQAFLDRAAPGPDPQRRSPLIAFRTAAAWGAVGETERGLAAFRRAAELGFDDLTSVDSDDDLAPLRPLPGYDEARGVIRRRALAVAEHQQGHQA